MTDVIRARNLLQTPSVPDLVLYDGGCGLCQRSVAFLARRDPAGSLFVFAPLGGETARTRLAGAGAIVPPGTVAVLTPEGRLLTRSDAALHALSRLGGAWSLLAAAGRLVPRPLRDGAYAVVARFRRRLFAPPEGPCPRLPSALARRFLP